LGWQQVEGYLLLVVLRVLSEGDAEEGPASEARVMLRAALPPQNFLMQLLFTSCSVFFAVPRRPPLRNSPLRSAHRIVPPGVGLELLVPI
jgi:hypothetical protein